MKRVFLIVLDSVGMGEMPDAAEYGDAGSNTILAVSKSPYFSMPNMKKLGYFNIDGMAVDDKEEHPKAAFARMTKARKERIQPSDIGRLRELFQKHRCRLIRTAFQKKS